MSKLWIVAWLGLGLLAGAASLPASAQQLKVRLLPDDPNPPAGAAVTFEGEIEPLLPNLEYRFIFGDGKETGWIPQPKAQNEYLQPGPYTARLEVRFRGQQTPWSAEASVIVRPLAPPPAAPRDVVDPRHPGEVPPGSEVDSRRAPRVSLRASDRFPLSGAIVTFEGEIEPPLPDLQYRFLFDDGEKTGWVSQPTAQHAYTQSGPHTTRLEVRRRYQRLQPTLGWADVSVSVQTLVEPLRVEISNPRPDAHVTIGKIELVAQVSGGQGVCLVQVILNGAEVQRLKQSTPVQVRLPLTLREGDNTLVIEATDQAHTQSRDERSIQYVSAVSPLEAWLKSYPSAPHINETVKFQGGTRPPSADVEYRFVFGDDTETDSLRIPETTHVYKAARRYTAYLLAMRRGGGVIVQIVQSPNIEVVVQEMSFAVSLHAAPERADTGTPVRFTARVGRPADALEYRFGFGDREGTRWTPNSTVTHSYRTAGSYPATVEVRTSAGTVVGTASAAVTVRAAPPPHWWLAGAAAASLTAAAGIYVARRRRRVWASGVRAVPRKHLESLTAQTTGAIDMGLEIQVRTGRGEWHHTIESERPIISGGGNAHGPSHRDA